MLRLSRAAWSASLARAIVGSYSAQSIMPKDTKAAKPAATGDKKAEKKRERKKSNPNTPITREATINLHKRIHGVYVSLLIVDAI